MKGPVQPIKIVRYSNSVSEYTDDLIVSEEPLEIRLKYFDGIDYREKSLAVTMRTPGNDYELAIGFLYTEGIISSHSDIDKIFYCEEVKEEEEGNVVVISLNKSKAIDEKTFNRNFYINSSCGVCGKSTIDSVQVACQTEFKPDLPSIGSDLIHRIPEQIAKDQSVFKHTGGLHAAALISSVGEVLLIREDIGRHNALDKLIGARLIENIENSESVLFVSGRAGFELVQKAVVAGIPIMISVGAPSSLAVELSKSYNQTLIGFARNQKFNVYSGKGRIK